MVAQAPDDAYPQHSVGHIRQWVAATALLQIRQDTGMTRDGKRLCSRRDHTTADAITTPE